MFESITYQRNLSLAGILALLLLLSGCGSHTYHHVRKGDTLYSIAWRYHQNFEDVARWNDIPPPYIIKPGQWLRVAPPAPGGRAFEEKREGRTPAPVRTLTQAPAPVRSSPPPRATSPAPTPPPVAASPPPAAPRASSAPAVPAPQANKAMPDLQGRGQVAWQWPARGRIIESFNARQPGKKGIAISGTRGSPVRAAARGKVVYSGNALKGYGNLLIIKHNDKYLSAYGYNDRVLVKEGEIVEMGQIVARMGMANATEAALYFEIRIDGKPVDPLRYLPRRGS